MEWLRSCYSSLWRLHSDPTIVTPGRYVRCPSGTPHLPTPHVYASRNWTNNERDIPSAVGEVDPPTKRPWRNGSLPVAFPAAVQQGGNLCLAGNVARPAPPGTLGMVAGFPAACWLSGALPVPAVTPTLWLLPDDLSVYTVGQLLTQWPDRGQSGNDASNLQGASIPSVTAGPATFNACLISTGAFLSLTRPVDLSRDFSLYLVAKVNWGTGPQPTMHWLSGGPANVYSPLVVNAGSLNYVSPSGTITYVGGGGLRVYAVWSVRRAGLAVNLGKNGTYQGPQLVPNADDLSASVATPNYAPFGVNKSVVMVEARVYPVALDDATDAALVASLRTRYGI